MGYIYKITNDINNKIYIGLTNLQNPADRWKRHLKDYKNATLYSKRPLYEAMQKYGIEHFSFQVIEETENTAEREKYWINYFRTYIGFKDCNGYNATLGGDGLAKNIFSQEEEDFIIDLFEEHLSCNEIAEQLNCTAERISLFLKSRELTPKSFKGNKVGQYSKDGILLQIFDSSKQAAEALNKKGKGGHITEVCNGIRKTAYGFIWKYI